MAMVRLVNGVLCSEEKCAHGGKGGGTFYLIYRILGFTNYLLVVRYRY